MTDILRIIQSDIIKNEQDVFWDKNDSFEVALQAKNVLVISLSYDKGGSDETQLLKMLSACQLSDEEYNILQVEADKKIPWNRLKHKLQPKTVLLVGILPKQLGISALFKLNMINHFDDITWIPTLSLVELEQQANTKKALWTQALKPFFVDNK